MAGGKRLSYYIEKQGFTKKDFCENFGFDYASFTQILAETRPLGIKLIDKIHDSLPKLNIHWMLYGEGSEEVVEEDVLLLNEPNETYKNEVDIFERTLIRYLEHEAVIKKINEIAQKTNKK